MLICSTSVIAEEIGVDSMPAVVVQTVPQSGDTSVDPNLTEIKVVFSKVMLIDRMSWVAQTKETTPEILGRPAFLKDGKTCVAKVKLQPNKTYVVWFNKDKYQHFQDLDGRPSLPYVLVFKTKLDILSEDNKMSSVEDVENIYEQYLDQLKKGDAEGATNYWNREEVHLYKFYDFALAPPHNFKQEISARCFDYDHEIVESNVYENHIIAKYKYTLKDQFRNKGKAPLNFYEYRYFIRENDRWALANPIKILTQDWKYHETDYLKIYFPKDIEIYSMFYQNVDSIYHNFVSLFNYEPQDKPFVYLCHHDQLEELSTVKGKGASDRTFPENNVIISIYEQRESTKELPEININLCAHELLHVLSYKIFGHDRRSVPFLREGLSVAYAGTGGIPAEVTFIWAQQAIIEDNDLSLSVLNDPEVFYSKINRHYGLAGSFVKFLVEAYGIEKFKTFYTQFDQPEKINDVLKENYNKTISEIETEWIEFVKNYKISFDKKWSRFTLQFIE